MSEYQYYEFLAVDRPLTDRQIDEVRAISSRAELTSTRFVNEYQWGDFKGNPHEFVSKYYDLMIYTANWGTHRLLIGLPRDAIDLKRAKLYATDTESGLDVTVRGERAILDLTSQEEDYDDEDYDNRWMSALPAVREELLSGDLRALFVSWLASVWVGGEDEEDEDELEQGEMTPPIPPGLARLTGAQKELAEFLRVDQDLLKAAAEASPPLQPAGTGLGDWIKALSAAEKDQMLLDLAAGHEPRLGAKLVRRFRSETAEPASDGPVLPLQKLLDRVRAMRDERKNKIRVAAERERQEREAARAAEREAHLTQLMKDEEKTWGQVEEILRLKQNRFYDDAVKTLRDLREVAVRKSALDAFVSRLRHLRETHNAKYTFVEKLDKAALLHAPLGR